MYSAQICFGDFLCENLHEPDAMAYRAVPTSEKVLEEGFYGFYVVVF